VRARKHMRLHIDRDGSTTERDFSGKAKDLLKELDINPLIVLEQGKGCFIADAKIILEQVKL